MKYSSSFRFLKYSLGKTIEVGEEVPCLTYDKAERKGQVRRIMTMNSIMVSYLNRITDICVMDEF